MKRRIIAIILWIVLSAIMIITWRSCFSLMGYKTTNFVHEKIELNNEATSGKGIEGLGSYLAQGSLVKLYNPTDNYEKYGTILGVSVVLYVPLTIGCYSLGWKRKEDKHDD